MANLILKNIYKKYDIKKTLFGKKESQQAYAVNNISYECADGEFIGILGPSGCGKSTTLRMIAGLEEITSGDMYINDQRINDLHPKDRGIGLAFEDYALYPPLTVYENLAFNMRAKKISDKDIKERIEYIAPLLKIEKLLDKMPASLSGGQKQRVNIARAIVRKPHILLLDEPLSHLDGKMRQQLRQEIKRMHHEIKCTTIIVTHDQMEAMSLADRIIIMNEGEIQQIGTPLEIYDNPANRFVADFIGEPPMNLLQTKIKQKGNSFIFTFENSSLELKVPDKYKKILHNDMEVTIGIRPTDVHIDKEKSLHADAVVSVYENLGDERRVSVSIGKAVLCMTTTDNIQYRPKDIIYLSFNAEKIHLFNNKTGKNLNRTL
ncbi:ABC transporter ATP-binding protein [Treponema socranskii]|uniref:ABC transporter, ATP-binding protein n=2 Tax=Treponema socranskii subsp. socranskii VPI DR56BR1116 = ATCC 35536 TaxID=1125725 RepID=A0ABN0P5U8_TRESO|nr:ABC transporter ATP-binding protein [Treponema socranskii]ERJ99807.1 ABC transporter, ATP-binding protein [Treponema socranskii subsp. socranskii VPI DR56BR1116 = ATCC 35536]MDR9859666.1 ABC transporter ATP-binding protein [Treponema socranskii]